MQDGVSHTRKYLHEVAGQRELSFSCRACDEGLESLGHILSKCQAHQFTLHKSRHDRVLYVLVRQVMEALSLPLPEQLQGPGGLIQPGVYRTTQQVIKVDLRHPTDETLSANRPDLVIRLQKSYIVEVARSWDGAVSTREREKKTKTSR